MYRSFPVNFAKFLRTPFFTEPLRWLLLKLPLNFTYTHEKCLEVVIHSNDHVGKIMQPLDSKRALGHGLMKCIKASLKLK